MIDYLKNLTALDGTSGDEATVRDYILSEIKDYCDTKIDALGNLIVFKRGKKSPAQKIMLDAHMDEVGLIITDITADGFLHFKTLGGINTSALLFKTVRINGKVTGVISGKPVHLAKDEETKKLPDADKLYIDIGAESGSEAETMVTVGDRAVMVSDFTECDGKIISKALDDRVGCAILIKLIKEFGEYDFTAVFSVQEEIGLRGARTAAYGVSPDAAIILEGTTAADIAGVDKDRQVCCLGGGAAVSFMDKSTVYDREYCKAALSSGIAAQPKRAVAGGNNAGVVHLSKEGVRTIALSVPCRYIHTSSSVADTGDIKAVYDLAVFMIKYIADDK